MIVIGEINEARKILSLPILVSPAGFLKNQLPASPTIFLEFFEFLLSVQKRGRGIANYVNL